MEFKGLEVRHRYTTDTPRVTAEMQQRMEAGEPRPPGELEKAGFENHGNPESVRDCTDKAREKRSMDKLAPLKTWKRALVGSNTPAHAEFTTESYDQLFFAYPEAKQGPSE